MPPLVCIAVFFLTLAAGSLALLSSIPSEFKVSNATGCLAAVVIAWLIRDDRCPFDRVRRGLIMAAGLYIAGALSTTLVLQAGSIDEWTWAAGWAALIAGVMLLFLSLTAWGADWTGAVSRNLSGHRSPSGSEGLFVTSLGGFLISLSDLTFAVGRASAWGDRLAYVVAAIGVAAVAAQAFRISGFWRRLVDRLRRILRDSEVTELDEIDAQELGSLAPRDGIVLPDTAKAAAFFAAAALYLVVGVGLLVGGEPRDAAGATCVAGGWCIAGLAVRRQSRGLLAGLLLAAGVGLLGWAFAGLGWVRLADWQRTVVFVALGLAGLSSLAWCVGLAWRLSATFVLPARVAFALSNLAIAVFSVSESLDYAFESRLRVLVGVVAASGLLVVAVVAVDLSPGEANSN